MTGGNRGEEVDRGDGGDGFDGVDGGDVVTWMTERMTRHFVPLQLGLCQVWTHDILILK